MRINGSLRKSPETTCRLSKASNDSDGSRRGMLFYSFENSLRFSGIKDRDRGVIDFEGKTCDTQTKHGFEIWILII